jgi:ADP-heptose:LPS heptosyltransferase
MRPEPGQSSRTLVIQMARLGDLIQTLPALESLRHRLPEESLDLLCAASLADLVRARFPVDRVLAWDGVQCRGWAERWSREPINAIQNLRRYVERLSPEQYRCVYNLNQHERAVLTAHLLGREVIGAGASGPLSADCGSWSGYLRRVAAHRAHNRIHLADAFCGLAGVRPRGTAPLLKRQPVELPSDLRDAGRSGGDWVAVVVGAGETERCVPPHIWTAWIERFLSADAAGRVILLGAGAEQEAAHAIQAALPSMSLGRLWDATGRTTLDQLTEILSRMAWVIGADTGPLHLGTAAGARAMGWYFARARVHETGPYGEGHWVFQHEGGRTPEDWPIEASIEIMLGESAAARRPEWELWRSCLDEWGAYFIGPGGADSAVAQRQVIWRQLSSSQAGW